MGPDHGTDDELTAGCDQDDRDAVQAWRQGGQGLILDELCATTKWHRNHARKALAAALKPRLVKPARGPRTPTYDVNTVVALRFCWAVLGAPTGKRLAPVMGELVPTLRRFEELDVTDDVAAALVAMSPATMDRRLAADRAKMVLKGRSHTKPGSLLKSQIPIRTWAQWDDAVPGFVEIDLVGHEGGNAVGEHCYTLTVTDIATGWTENRSVRDKARKWVIAARSPSPGLGRGTVTTARMWSRRTGRSCGPWSATTATTRPQNWCCSTRSGFSSHR